MYAVPKPGYDLETMRAVALAYRRERRAGRLDEAAHIAKNAAPYVHPRMPTAAIPTGDIPPLRLMTTQQLQRLALELSQDEYHEVQDDDGKPGGQESPDSRKPAGEGTG